MTESRGKAFFIRQLDGWRGVANLYRLEPAHEGHEHVVVSAVNAMFSGPETFIFGCDAEGKPTSMLELSGSFQGGRDHAKALDGAGYDIVEQVHDGVA